MCVDGRRLIGLASPFGSARHSFKSTGDNMLQQIVFGGAVSLVKHRNPRIRNDERGNDRPIRVCEIGKYTSPFDASRSFWF
jgi:hypothetical protein